MTGAVVFRNAIFGAGNGSILLDEVTCTGDEQRLVQCPSRDYHNCQHNEDVGVRCIDRRKTWQR